MNYCPACRHCAGTSSRRVCALGMLSAPGETTTCARWEAPKLPASPLTAAEIAELARLEVWRMNLGPYSLIALDDRNWVRLLALRARAV